MQNFNRHVICFSINTKDEWGHNKETIYSLRTPFMPQSVHMKVTGCVANVSVFRKDAIHITHAGSDQEAQEATPPTPLQHSDNNANFLEWKLKTGEDKIRDLYNGTQ